MSILLICLVIVIAMIMIGAVMGKLTWERAIVLVIVVAIVAAAFYFISGVV